MSVPRLDNEDRPEAYRRLLDTSARSFGHAYQFAPGEAGRAANKVCWASCPGVGTQQRTHESSAVMYRRHCG